MATRFRDVLMRKLGELRYEPIDKRIRATLAGQEVIDSKRALLVWEPKRVVPSYGVAVEDVDAQLIAAATPDQRPGSSIVAPQLGGRPIYDPSIPFSVHTTVTRVKPRTGRWGTRGTSRRPTRNRSARPPT